MIEEGTGTPDPETPAQRRRREHKEKSRKTHAHEKGVRCQRCRPAAKEKPPVWRESGKPLEVLLKGESE